MLLRVFTEPQQGASYDQLLAVARVAEESGFDAFFRSDHYLRFGPGDGLPGPTDAWVTLAGLARETSRIRLGTLVTPVTFRLPGPLAIQVAQVDAMSGGRAPATLTLSPALTVCCGADGAEVERRAKAIGRPADRIDLAGTPAQVVDTLGRFAAAGAERAYLQVLDLDDLDHVRLIGDEVLRHLP